MTYRSLLKEIEETLSRNPDLIARGLTEVESLIILQFAIERTQEHKLSTSEIKMRLDEKADPSQSDQIHKLALAVAGKRAEGEILQYVTGSQIFLDHEYRVTPDVLVPRPETEILVRTAMENLDRPALGLELGLGSGAISIELLARFPELEMVTTEVSQGAIQIARENARAILGEKNSRLRILPFVKLMDVCEPFKRFLKDRCADFLISNPPYLLSTDEIADDVREHEPDLALFAPLDDPLYYYRKIATQSGEFLHAKAKVFLEIPHERADAILHIFNTIGWKTKLVPDLTGRPRVLIASGP